MNRKDISTGAQTVEQSALVVQKPELPAVPAEMQQMAVAIAGAVAGTLPGAFRDAMQNLTITTQDNKHRGELPELLKSYVTENDVEGLYRVPSVMEDARRETIHFSASFDRSSRVGRLLVRFFSPDGGSQAALAELMLPSNASLRKELCKKAAGGEGISLEMSTGASLMLCRLLEEKKNIFIVDPRATSRRDSMPLIDEILEILADEGDGRKEYQNSVRQGLGFGGLHLALHLSVWLQSLSKEMTASLIQREGESVKGTKIALPHGINSGLFLLLSEILKHEAAFSQLVQMFEAHPGIIGYVRETVQNQRFFEVLAQYRKAKNSTQEQGKYVERPSDPICADAFISLLESPLEKEKESIYEELMQFVTDMYLRTEQAVTELFTLKAGLHRREILAALQEKQNNWDGLLAYAMARTLTGMDALLDVGDEKQSIPHFEALLQSALLMHRIERYSAIPEEIKQLEGDPSFADFKEEQIRQINALDTEGERLKNLFKEEEVTESDFHKAQSVVRHFFPQLKRYVELVDCIDHLLEAGRSFREEYIKYSMASLELSLAYPQKMDELKNMLEATRFASFERLTIMNILNLTSPSGDMRWRKAVLWARRCIEQDTSSLQISNQFLQKEYSQGVAKKPQEKVVVETSLISEEANVQISFQGAARSRAEANEQVLPSSQELKSLGQLFQKNRNMIEKIIEETSMVSKEASVSFQGAARSRAEANEQVLLSSEESKSLGQLFQKNRNMILLILGVAFGSMGSVAFWYSHSGKKEETAAPLVQKPITGTTPSLQPPAIKERSGAISSLVKPTNTVQPMELKKEEEKLIPSPEFVVGGEVRFKNPKTVGLREKHDPRRIEKIDQEGKKVLLQISTKRGIPPQWIDMSELVIVQK